MSGQGYSRASEELGYCKPVAKVMMLSALKGDFSIVKVLYFAVLKHYEFEGVFTLFYVLASVRNVATHEAVPPGPDAPAGDHLGFRLSRLMVATEFQAAWELFEREFLNVDPTEDIHLGTLYYLINAVGSAALIAAMEESEEDKDGQA